MCEIMNLNSMLNFHAPDTEELQKPYQLYEDAFFNASGRDPRSYEYKQGVLDVLIFRFSTSDGRRIIKRYEFGTVQADAWYSGIREGHTIYRDYLSESTRTLNPSLLY